jgi:GTP pyrophosphokinase
MGMINDITTVISGSMGMDMKSMSIESNNGVFTGNINLEVKIKVSWKRPLKNLKVSMAFQE